MSKPIRREFVKQHGSYFANTGSSNKLSCHLQALLQLCMGTHCYRH